jgi:hypothetical protein
MAVCYRAQFELRPQGSGSRCETGRPGPRCRYVLEGSVRKAANRVRISAQLIEAENGHHLWAERYDRDLADVFSLQDEITIRVVAAIEPNLRQAEIERVRRKRPHTIDAYDLLLRALPNVYTCEGAGKGLLQLEQALAIEPTYALAHGFAAWAHEIIYVFGGMRAENYEKSIRHAHAAIENGPGDAMALALPALPLAWWSTTANWRTKPSSERWR